MLALIAFAFVSGIITILSPCILPVLPIVLGGSVGGGKARPLGVIAGFVISFTLFTLALTALVDALGIPSNALRIAAVVLIVGLGLVMVVPQLRDRFELLASKLTSRTKRGAGGSGFAGGVPIGLSLGLVWTPCVGPIMASVIALALTQQVDGGAALITLSYTLGTSIPMMAIMFGGRTLLTRVPALLKNTPKIQRGFGVVTILAGLAIGFGLDLRFQASVLRIFPNYGSGLTAIENSDLVQDALQARNSSADASQFMMSATNVSYDSFDQQPRNGRLGDYGPAPELVTRGEWLNWDELGLADTLNPSSPISMRDLRGKVVIIDFWTYSCVNCVRTIPYLTAWWDAYKDQNLVIIGVHTPEFEFEKSQANVARAMKNLGVEWPVVLDNAYAQWGAYKNRYWPAKYFVDAEGHIRYFHFGEGEYDTSEKVIKELLREAGASVARRSVTPSEARLSSRTPETYLGYGRAQGFVSSERLVVDRASEYTPAGQPGNAEWNLEGVWTIAREHVESAESGTLSLGFNAKDVYLVIEPIEGTGEREEEARIDVLVDGERVADTEDVRAGVLIPTESRLYQLVGLKRRGEHVLSLGVHGPLRLFAFTFG